MVMGGGVVKATWAVACLLFAAVLVIGGCATNKVAEAPMPAGKAAGNVPAEKVTASQTPAPGAGERIREENVIQSPVPGKSAIKPTAAIPPVASVDQSKAVEPAGPEYLLGPEDVIRVSVWDNRELTTEVVVRPDGKISMPLIQDVTAEGVTAVELASRIQKNLLAFVKEPQVSVIVLQVNSPKYYVVGNVTRPGTYALRGETTVLQALAVAGGFTTFASPRSIKLIRNASGKQEVRKINYYNIIDDGGDGNYSLKSGDTIVVP
jgi:polysaccharide export outer membrane protein